jgi:hypothetical protein
VNQFVTNEQFIIIQCPAGHGPVHTKHDPEKKIYTAKFDKGTCALCPFQEQCSISQQKKFNTVRFTELKLQSDTFRSSMDSERYKALSRFRAGVEGVVSALRRGLQVDHLPVRGFLRSKLWIHTKIVAFFKMLFLFPSTL